MTTAAEDSTLSAGNEAEGDAGFVRQHVALPPWCLTSPKTAIAYRVLFVQHRHTALSVRFSRRPLAPRESLSESFALIVFGADYSE